MAMFSKMWGFMVPLDPLDTPMAGGIKGFFQNFSRGEKRWQNLFFPSRN